MMKWKLGLLCLLPLTIFAQDSVRYKNLVMEGGGVRGLAYAGALEVLEQKGIIRHIEKVAGSSAGSIAGLMVALNYSSYEVDSVLQNLQIEDFNDGKFFIGKIKRIKNQFGLYKGDAFASWISALVLNKTGNADFTFMDLHKLHLQDPSFKDFYCTGTNISKQQTEVFSWQTYPDMMLKTAVHISSCIPFYFVPVAIDSAGNEVAEKDTTVRFSYFADGGMLCNYPVNLFDSCADGGNPLTCKNLIYNKQTLGLKLERGEQITEFEEGNTLIAPYTIQNMKQYASAVMNLMMETINRKSSDLSNEKGRTIYISFEHISGKPRKIPEKMKKVLYDNGKAAAIAFFGSDDHQKATTSF